MMRNLTAVVKPNNSRACSTVRRIMPVVCSALAANSPCLEEAPCSCRFVFEGTLPTLTRNLLFTAREIAATVLTPTAARIDAECAWSQHSIDALRDAGLLGLNVPQRFGGHEEGLLALFVMTEALAGGSLSSAICYGMRCVGSAVITAKAPPLLSVCTRERGECMDAPASLAHSAAGKLGARILLAEDHEGTCMTL